MMVGGFFFMVILAVVVVALLVWGTSTTARGFWARRDQNTEERSALQILEDRFARGEIDRGEFERRRAILTRP